MNVPLPETAFAQICHLPALAQGAPPAAAVNGPGVEILRHHRATCTNHAVRKQAVGTKPCYSVVGVLGSDMEISQSDT